VSTDVVHNSDARRFEVRDGDVPAVLEYQLVPGRIVFTHTGVPKDMEGRGIGGALARAGLEHARRHDLAVRPVCPFVAAYIARHPEYADLVR
jgi:predicted GNAT family acetyltransferase